MLRVTRITTHAADQSRYAAGVWRAAASQPGWITRIALMTFLLVVGLPILLLVMAAILIAAVVFAGLALLNGVVARVRGMRGGRGALGRRDGRANVRVIRRSDSEPTP